MMVSMRNEYVPIFQKEGEWGGETLGSVAMEKRDMERCCNLLLQLGGPSQWIAEFWLPHLNLPTQTVG